MQQRLYVSFETDIVDDWVENAAGHIVTPSGKNVLNYIADKLKANGVVVTPTLQHSSYGWAFWAEYRGVRFYCLVQRLKLWLVTVRPARTLVDRFLFRSRTAENRAFADMVVQIMGRDPRFKDIALQSEDEFRTTARSRQR
jgi:hypothetical protein